MIAVRFYVPCNSKKKSHFGRVSHAPCRDVTSKLIELPETGEECFVRVPNRFSACLVVLCCAAVLFPAARADLVRLPLTAATTTTLRHAPHMTAILACARNGGYLTSAIDEESIFYADAQKGCLLPKSQPVERLERHRARQRTEVKAVQEYCDLCRRRIPASKTGSARLHGRANGESRTSQCGRCDIIP